VLLEPCFGKAHGCASRTLLRRDGRGCISNPEANDQRGIDERRGGRRRWLEGQVRSHEAVTNDDARSRTACARALSVEHDWEWQSFRTSGCTGARAAEIDRVVHGRRAGPVNLIVRRLPARDMTR
jgi:hypothetical protein